MGDQLARTAKTTTELAGRKYEYTYSSGMKARLELTEDTANWEILEGANKGEKGANKYLAREIAEGIYFTQWYEPEINATISLVINENVGSISSSAVYDRETEFDTGVIH